MVWITYNLLKGRIQRMQTNHIAILVSSINAISQTLPSSCTRHAIEEQPTEGTLEQYITVGDANIPAILLLQAIAGGPYSRALKKRGTGLHHVGCVCTSIDEEIASGRLRPLLLHPISLQSRKNGTVWFCRPGLPYLIELTQDPKQDAIQHEKVILQLPKSMKIPEYACVLSPNLMVKTAKESLIVIEVGGIEITIDPNTV